MRWEWGAPSWVFLKESGPCVARGHGTVENASLPSAALERGVQLRLLLIAKADKMMEKLPKGRQIVLFCTGWEISGVSPGRV